MTPGAGGDVALSERIEEATLNNMQSRQQLVYDGWLVFLLPGKAKRARSVSAHFGSTLPLEDKIVRCEALYAGAGLPALFRITPFSKPAGLDAALASRGYVAFDTTLVQHACVQALRSPPPAEGIVLTQPPLETFVDDVGTLRGSPASQRRAHLARLAGSPLALHPVVARRHGRLVGAGLMSDDGALGGLFDVTVAQDSRGAGIGSAIVSALVATATARGLADLYLQVTENNAAAVALYRRCGFATLYRYHYRSREPEVD